jgi:hypothetical protein
MRRMLGFRRSAVAVLVAIGSVAAPLAVSRGGPHARSLPTALDLGVAAGVARPDFGPPARLPSSGPLRWLVAIDIDQDGDLDLVGQTYQHEFVLWINDGHGHFSPPAPVAQPAGLNGRQAALDGHTPDREPALRRTHTPSAAPQAATASPTVLACGSAACGHGRPAGASSFSLSTPRAPPLGSARHSS